MTKEQLKAIDNIYDSKEKVAFLTFDDGPSSNVTPKILDVLKKENIKATFFVLGTMVKANPEVLKREKKEGHYIANHSYSHEYSKIYKSSNAVLKEYNKTEEQIKRALGNENYSSNLFRFPGGSTGGEYDKVKEKAKKELDEACRNFEYAQDDLIDYYTYQIKATRAKFDYLVKQAKSQKMALDMIKQIEIKLNKAI